MEQLSLCLLHFSVMAEMEPERARESWNQDLLFEVVACVRALKSTFA